MVLFQKVSELLVDGFLQYFGQEGEGRDRTVALEIVGIGGGFLQKGSDVSVFPSVREGCCGDGGFEDARELRAEVEEVDGAGVRGTPEWMEDMMAEVIRAVSGDQVMMVWLFAGWLRLLA